MENVENKVKKPFYKCWWFYVIIVIVTLMIVAGLRQVVESNSNNSDELPADTNELLSGTDKPQNEYYINDKVIVGNLEYVINQVVDTEFFIIGDDIVKTDNNFIKITFTIKNTSINSEFIMASKLKLRRGEAQYKVQYASSDLVWYELAPGLSKKFFVIFEVPDKSTEYDYLFSIENGEDTKEIILRECEAKTV